MKEFAQITPIPAPRHERVSFWQALEGRFREDGSPEISGPDAKARREMVVFGGMAGRIQGRENSTKTKEDQACPGIDADSRGQQNRSRNLAAPEPGACDYRSATKFQDFITEVYKPIVIPLMAASTQNRYQGVLKNYLTPAFGELCLRDITALSVQRYFSGMASSALEHESKDKIRDVLSSACGAAVQYGFLVKNPVESIKLPPPKKGKKSKPYVTPDQFEAFVARIREPYASMVYVAVYTGLRVGLRWRNVHTDSITIEERYCRGDWGAPKSESSSATVPVNACVIDHGTQEPRSASESRPRREAPPCCEIRRAG
jgi:Phage integrase, N-terminal SAM-like domain